MKLKREFFCDDPLTVAHNLVGAYLCRRMPDGRVVRARICELELYTPDDRASHAYNYRRTARNDAMFLLGGFAYVYLCYGLHNMFNIVIGPAEFPSAVLIRAVEYENCNGPAKLTRVLDITRNDNKIDLCGDNNIWLESRDCDIEIACGARIGIDFAGADAMRPWRFIIANSKFISHPV